MRHVTIYDTTLRDGAQAEELNLTTEDKVRIAHKLDELGIHYIEGGWPGSNPTDKKFFEDIKKYTFKNAKLTAFGSTHFAKTSPEKDPNLAGLLAAGTSVITIFGKSWDLHATTALGISLERNLELIFNSIAFLNKRVDEVIFDAEHFFDGYKHNPEYALKALAAAHEAGAARLVLCDTNGGTLTHEVAEAVKAVQAHLPAGSLGIHAHNDSELAVANSLEAVRLGASQVQGTINGYGERCGNANLCSVIPNLELKMGIDTIGRDNLPRLLTTSHFVSEIGNLRPFMRQPFVGASAFAHKGGIHVSAILKDSRTYEHIVPESVGNEQRVLLSDQAGRSNILFKAKELGYELAKDDPTVDRLLAELKQKESMGYEYSVADASFELVLREALGKPLNYFHFRNFFVVDAKREEDPEPFTEATVIIDVKGQQEHTAATGMGPVNALDRALRKGLERFYPNLSEIRLLDFKVRVLSGAVRDTGGTASFVRVLVETGDKTERWTTMGVSHNIIEASWQAVVDAINYKLLKDDQFIEK
ncbi:MULTISPECIES: citramalate synthase [unclassified Pseudodesulfovibrio]|uniref:citramalate synthase n=1 Tax=unclassified Pseudodesulfovibrio TaxID=2661612 RepID=UPI000FEBDE6F|nr:MULTISPECIES: citramalate synthase [unclassified Pseudodesulfovibrio]MCJ2163741.1 citramalate synthase [Pseudodesulfovibrio sp. S3-i]RWU06006.1 citramalate synthase [Pseudodesulfovibrio sp. S3]